LVHTLRIRPKPMIATPVRQPKHVEIGHAGRPELLIVAALREELAPLLRRLGDVETIASGPLRHLRARLRDSRVIVAWTGEGVRNAERVGRSLLPLAPDAPLLVVGVAGALSPMLKAGDLVIGESIREGSISFATDPEWVERARRAGAEHCGVVATVDEVVTAADRKLFLWEELGRPAAAVVDMESSRLAALAAGEGRPFLIVRAVSDEAGDELPRFLERCRDSSGALDRGRVLRQVLRRPSSLYPLLRLRRRVEICAERLAELVVRLAVSPCGSGPSEEVP